jgi:transcriptional regulator with XRE-family HTH domain
MDEEQRVHAGMERLGQLLRQCREQAGLSPDDICARIQRLSTDMLVAIESGRRPASVTTLHELTALIGMTPEELFQGIYPWDTEFTP